MKKIIYSPWIVTAILTLMVSGCNPQGFEPATDGKITSIAVKGAVYVSTGTPSMQLSVKDNEEKQLDVVIRPGDAKNQKLTFANRHPEVMEVTEAGVLKPKVITGRDTLTISSTDGSGVTITYVVNIIDHTTIKATAINVDLPEKASEIKLKIGDAPFNLAAYVTLTPADTWNKGVTYTSNKVSVVTVSAAGMVTVVGEGTATITIKTTDGSNLSRNCDVKVTAQ